MKHIQKQIVSVACFGAIRPMKNHLIQAIAAIKFANEKDVTLRFHINGSRIENNGDPVLKNLRNLFANNPQHELVEHAWMTHDEFVKVIKSMDICLQISFSETFNIVTADAVNNNIPVVVSNEISWVSSMYKANSTSSTDILCKMNFVWSTRHFMLHFINKIKLYFYSQKTQSVWLRYFLDEGDGVCCDCGCNCNILCNCDCDC